MPFKMLGTSPLLGHALLNAWDRPALGTGPSKFLGQARFWDMPFKMLGTGPLLGAGSPGGPEQGNCGKASGRSFGDPDHLASCLVVLANVIRNLSIPRNGVRISSNAT